MITLAGNGIIEGVGGAVSGGVKIVAIGSGSLPTVTGAVATATRSGTLRNMTGTFSGGSTFLSTVSRRRAMLSTLIGGSTFTSLLARRAAMNAQFVGGSTLSASLGRRRPLVSRFEGGLDIESDFHCTQLFPNTFHVPINRSEILLTAVIRGFYTADVSYVWTLRTVAGSGREKLLTQLAHSTLLINMIPYGHYVVNCAIDNGEGRHHNQNYTILVDAAAI